MDDFLSKPLRVADLSSKLERWLPSDLEEAALSSHGLFENRVNRGFGTNSEEEPGPCETHSGKAPRLHSRGLWSASRIGPASLSRRALPAGKIARVAPHPLL
jgi:hypothetical protein